MNDPKRVVESLYAAFKENDQETVRALLSPDVVWSQCEGFPGGSRRVGPDDVIAGIFGSNRTYWDGFRAEPTKTIVQDEIVIVLGRYHGRSRTTGHEMQAVFAHVYTVRDAVIQEFEQIVDTVPMVRELGQ